MFPDGGKSGTGGVTAWLLLFAASTLLQFGWEVPSFATSHGLPVMDLELTRSAARTMELVARYGERGRSDYLVFLTLDCFFAAAASLFLISVLRAALGYLRVGERRLRFSVLLAAAPAVLDVAENVAEAALIVAYPRLAMPLAELVWAITQLKLLALALAGGSTAVTLGLALHRRLVVRRATL